LPRERRRKDGESSWMTIAMSVFLTYKEVEKTDMEIRGVIQRR
jgi:hypothetical protein